MVGEISIEERMGTYMTVKEVKKFGTPRKIFKGKGKVKLSDGSEIQAQFTLAQLLSAELIFIVYIKRATWTVMTHIPQIMSLTGTLLDGGAISAQGFVV